ncbi:MULTISPECIES: MlaE family lipid ABC transporter permease subunit [unclassified Chamaesiphon]|uniref:MlaE family lipid ABC transporter permease subunit n=1 Tax=unclassified Chamaesiphon TaxID=2620921 RepID=UPI00286CAF82|nr:MULTISPECIES: MlaE family lipid ABC transporter permease subunit [unclassified Chamaesiphon]
MAPRSGANSHPYAYRRFGFTVLLLGQVWLHLIQGKTCWHKISEHSFKTGPAAMIPVLLSNFMAGIIFTIQTARQLEPMGALGSVGGVFAIAFCRELAPILTACVIAGQVGSAFAAEIGSMKVSEQIDALYTLRTDPIDYLILPRVLACGATVPISIVLGLVCGIAGGIFVAAQLYQLPPLVFLDSARSFLKTNDLIVLGCKGVLFGVAIGTIGCGWGMTTYGGVKQVGESATAAVIVSGIAIFAIDLAITLFFGDVPTNKQM